MTARWTRTYRLALVLVAAGALLLAGCLVGQSEGPTSNSSADANASNERSNTTMTNGTTTSDTPTTSRAPAEWGVYDCQTVLASIPVDADALQPRLPDGFRPLTPEGFGLPPDATGDAVLGFKALDCQQVLLLDEPTSPTRYAAVWSPVEVPQDRDDDSQVHFLAWDTFMGDPDQRPSLVEAGLPLVDGDVTFERFQTTPAGHVVQASFQLGDHAFSIEATANQEDELHAEGFRYTDHMPGDEGLAEWRAFVDADTFRKGAGTVHLADGHWSSDIVGEPTTQAFVAADPGLSFADGTVSLPSGR